MKARSSIRHCCLHRRLSSPAAECCRAARAAEWAGQVFRGPRDQRASPDCPDRRVSPVCLDHREWQAYRALREYLAWLDLQGRRDYQAPQAFEPDLNLHRPELISRPPQDGAQRASNNVSGENPDFKM